MLTVTIDPMRSAVSPCPGWSSRSLAGVLLAACATEEHYNRMLAGWVGRPLDDLMIQWGPPDKSAVLSRGGKVIEYDRKRIVTTGGYTRYEPVS